MLLFLALALLLFTGWEGYLYIKDNFTSYAARQVTMPQVVNSATHVSDNEDRVVSRRPQVHYNRPDFEAGIVFPEWTPDGYGAKWQQQLPAIQTQSGARWMEMTVFLSQATDNSTQVRTNQSTPTPQSNCPSPRSEEHTSELQSPDHLVCRLLLEKKKSRT